MISSKVTLKQLETIVCVADIGTFRGAAAVLGTTQPNVSARINALETALGTILLLRNDGPLRPTVKGELLLEKARQVLRATEEFLEEADRKDLIEDRLRLGVTELVAATWLHEFMRRFNEAYPAIPVELEVDLSLELERRLLEGSVDLAFLSTNSDPQAGQTCVADDRVILTAQPYVWVATSKIADEVGTAPSLAALSDAFIITHARHTNASRALDEALVADGISRSRVIHSSSLMACRQMVLDGMGVGLLPLPIVEADILAGELVALETMWLPEPLAFEARFDSTRAPRFIENAVRYASAIDQEN